METNDEYNEITSLQVEIAECAEKLQRLQNSSTGTTDDDPLARLEEAERLVSRLEVAGTKLTRIKATSATKRQEALAAESEENQRLDDSRRSNNTSSSVVEPISIASSPNEVILQKVSLQVQAPAPLLPQRQEPFNLGAPILSSSSSVTRGASFRTSSSPPSTGNSLQRFMPIVSSTSNLTRGTHVDLPELSLPDLRSPLRGRFSADIMASREQVSRRIRPAAPIQTPMRQQQQLQPSVPSTSTPFESRNSLSMMGPAPLPQDKAIARGGGSGGGGGASLSNTGNSIGAPFAQSLQSIPNRPIPIPSASSNSSIFPQTQQSLSQSTQNPPQQLPQEALAYAALYYYYAALATAAQGSR